MKGKNILLGITGSIAAYKAAILIRLLVKQGVDVRVLMTPFSKKFITPLTLSTLSKNPIFSEESALLEGLANTVSQVIQRGRAEQEREKLINELREAISKIKTLSGMFPICSSCKKIRDDKGYWNQIEAYIRDHSEAKFSHGLCPECADKLYGDEDWYKRRDEDK